MKDSIKKSEAIEYFRKVRDNGGTVPRSDQQAAFYGPNSHFTQAVQDAARDLNLLGDMTKAELMAFAPKEKPVLSAIANFFLDADAKGSLSKLRSAFQAVTAADQTFEMEPHEEEWFDEAKKHFGKLQMWTASIADWQMLTIVNDHLSPKGDRSQLCHTDKTPIFLANETAETGTILRLCAERLPGPPIVSPDRWRLGNVPLNNDLMAQFHHGLQTVLNAIADKDRFQIRWWLESIPAMGWHQKVAEPTRDPKTGKVKSVNTSVQAAAACLALALRRNKTAEKQGDYDQLDPTVGISASLPESAGTTLLDRPLGSVGHVKQKCSDAHAAKLTGFVLASDCKQQHKSDLNEEQNGHYLPISGALTLADALEALKLTNKELIAAKLCSVVNRDGIKAMEWPVRHVCTRTEQEFIDASGKKED